MEKEYSCPCLHKCPLQQAMDVIGGKWKIEILCSLHTNGSTRYNELKKKTKGDIKYNVGKISERTGSRWLD